MRITKEHIGKRIIRRNKFGTVVNDGIVKDVYEPTADSRKYVQLEGSGCLGPYLWQDSSEFGSWELVSEEPEGISLLEAMQSGREFHRIGEDGVWSWFCVDRSGYLKYATSGCLVAIDANMLTARYKLKPEPTGFASGGGDV